MSAHPPLCPGRAPEAGVTLVEMLVVLVILGIAGTASALGLAGLGRDRGAEVEAARLAARITGAVDLSLVEGQRLALFWTAQRYEIRRWGGEDWVAADSGPLAAHDLPEGTSLRRLDGSPAPVEIAPDGLAPPVALQLLGPTQAWTLAFDGLNVRTAPSPLKGLAP